MNVKTAELKNNLSKYLQLVREKGETIIVCDRDTPIATLAPLLRDENADWKHKRAEALARAKKCKIEIDIPAAPPKPGVLQSVKPTLAPDGRTDLNSIDFSRGERDY